MFDAKHWNVPNVLRIENVRTFRAVLQRQTILSSDFLIEPLANRVVHNGVVGPTRRLGKSQELDWCYWLRWRIQERAEREKKEN